jgi:hypothetical protein
MSGPCLCIVFNHPYPQNVPVLERLYRSRFSTIRYLIPFQHDSSNPDVIATYRGSYQHQGFITDALPALSKVECSHFIFVQDDVLLNPSINEQTILSELGCVEAGDGFVGGMGPLDVDIGSWHWILGILWKLYYPRNQLSGTGVDSLESWLSYLPSVDQALKKASKYGIGLSRVSRAPNSLNDQSVVIDMPYFATHKPEYVRLMNRLVVDSLFDTAPEEVITLPYPFVMTAWGADLFALPKSRLVEYAHYAGVMAAAGLFAEIAVGTALMLVCDTVNTAQSCNLKLEWLWSSDREDHAMDLIALFKSGYWAVHPVKVSKVPNIETLMA